MIPEEIIMDRLEVLKMGWSAFCDNMEMTSGELDEILLGVSIPPKSFYSQLSNVIGDSQEYWEDLFMTFHNYRDAI